MRILAKEDRLQLIALLKDVGCPDPEVVADSADSKLARAVKDGKIRVRSENGKMVFSTEDMERAFAELGN